MGHLEVSGISYALSDGRALLADVSFRVGDGSVTALIGPNGTGKTTLLRIITGELSADDGAIGRSGGLAVMPQFIGSVRDSSTVRDLLLSVSPAQLQVAAAELDASELAMMESDDDATAMRYAQAISDWADVHGYEQENLFDKCTVAALGIPYDRAQYRDVTTLSGGEQKRLVLELLLAGPEDVLLLDEPDNYLDVPGKVWLEDRLAETSKSVLFISHDRELLSRAATRIVTLEPGIAGAVSWVHGGSFATYHAARNDRNSRLEELRLRWDEEHAKLKALVLMLKTKSAFNDGLASRYQAAMTRLAKFEAAGPPQAVPLAQKVSMRLSGGRTAKRAVTCANLELTGLMQPFDLEVFFGERLAVLGSNGSGKSHFLRLLAAGGSDPDLEHQPVSETPVEPVRHTGVARLGSRVRPGYFRQTHAHPELRGRSLLEILHPEEPCFPWKEPQEEPRCPRHPVDVGHDGGALPVTAVLHHEVIAKFGVFPQCATLDVVEILDQIERPEPATTVNRRLQCGHQDLRVVLALYVTVDPEADHAVGHAVELLNHGQDRTRCPWPVVRTGALMRVAWLYLDRIVAGRFRPGRQLSALIDSGSPYSRDIAACSVFVGKNEPRTVAAASEVVE